MLGFARMRQLRVRNDSCSVFPSFSRYRTVCYGPYSVDSEDTRPFGAAAIKYRLRLSIVGLQHRALVREQVKLQELHFYSQLVTISTYRRPP